MYEKLRKNSLLIVILAALSMLILTGCTKGSSIVKNGSELNTPTKMSMIYDEFSGYKETQIKVEEGQPVQVKVSFVTVRGPIDAYIAKDNNRENSSYEGHAIPTSEFTVTLKEQGIYTIRVDAKNHSGSYSFSW
ncbi:MAG: hypothetical protein KBA08_03475 [Firmicutes bacterium]|nr:hypothetical protein [Bacillota bacterium]